MAAISEKGTTLQPKGNSSEDVIVKNSLYKADNHFNELVIDVNTRYFEEHGGYEYAKQFYEEAYGNRCKRFDLLLGGRL